MPVELGALFPRDYAGRPPHVSSQDLPLWDRFQHRFGSDFIGFYFDASLGTPSEVQPDTPENLKRMWTRLTSKRIDVVGVRLNEIWIIELRPSAAAGALGTIMTYIELWREDPPFEKPAFPVIVTDVPDPDLRRLAKKQNITLIEV